MLNYHAKTTLLRLCRFVSAQCVKLWIRFFNGVIAQDIVSIYIELKNQYQLLEDQLISKETEARKDIQNLITIKRIRGRLIRHMRRDVKIIGEIQFINISIEMISITEAIIKRDSQNEEINRDFKSRAIKD
ncbi:unnamed protein product (macronuclear) [Paramecium tetraurelia]|uniref:Uncharacterized protein n=1 Tax=Paramecium tetraurelia TaxID=5888 RepID=A0E331_PARTE|nr:uncharacterized protein GSPATT00022871001 [Paramecium tetraurelia]CAK89698.1 unnamed protein product [Paramecium tetraurelia]|eukprot:XP_001457095.1 hypothetical protein (macronuclear) [Paramecium tetraurelia strain d4-2]